MSSNIEIRKVNGRCDLNKFIAFPNKLFKDVPTYLPPLNRDERALLTDKNPSLEHCDLQLYLALRDGKVVGRVAAIINHTVNEHWNKKAVRFGWFDFIEDFDVCKALFDKVVEFGKAKGMNEIEGPFGFTDMDKECWVIEGFDARQNLSTLYKPEYLSSSLNVSTAKSNAVGNSIRCQPVSRFLIKLLASMSLFFRNIISRCCVSRSAARFIPMLVNSSTLSMSHSKISTTLYQ